MDNREMLGKEKVGKLLFKLSMPAILAQLINILYNLVDRLYIAGLKVDATMSGLTICFPILMIISAFSALVGMSGAPLASIELGKGDKEKAERIMNNSFVMLLIISVVITIVVEVFQDGILRVFGATDSALIYAKQYITIYAAGTIFVQLAMGLNSFIGTQGFSKVSMMSVVIGAVLNIILDPLFIFAFNMGIQGAATATIISQAVSAIWVVSFLVGKKTMLRLNFREMKLSGKIVLSILALGISPFIMQATESLVHITFNNGFRQYAGSEEAANIAIAGMGILCTTMQLMSMPLMGLAQGGQPIISFNYGAKNMDRVKDTFKYMLISSACFCGLMWILVMAVPQMFAVPLATSEAVVDFGVKSLRIFMAGTIVMCFQFSCQQSLVALGQAKISLFLALFRKIIMLIPLAIVLPMLMTDNPMLGLLISEPIADVTAAIVTTICFAVVFKKLRRRVEESRDVCNRDEKCPHELACDGVGAESTCDNGYTSANAHDESDNTKASVHIDNISDMSDVPVDDESKKCD